MMMSKTAKILIALLSIAVVLLGGFQISRTWSDALAKATLSGFQAGQNDMLNSIFSNAVQTKSVILNLAQKIEPNCEDTNVKKCEIKSQSITLLLKDETRGKN